MVLEGFARDCEAGTLAVVAEWVAEEVAIGH